MFAARLHDETLESFTREEALNLLPKSNPFLRKLFEYVAGPSLADGLRRTVDELAEIFQATDLQKLFENFGSFTQRNDPFIHFYETFLAEYNPAKRKARGVWYTPEPVVNFIVRAVDEVLQNEFGLADGLADTSKVTVDWDTGQTIMEKGKAKPVMTKKELHRVQILDPAAGTGTFLAEVIKQIAPKIQGVAPGQWPSYVEKELIPRLHGFELLMASYAMCHMKLDMMLSEMGYKPTKNPPRLSVYLTNSLEEGERVNQSLPFAQWLSNEAKEANTIKRDMPIMCVIGNPPYSGISQNMGDWIVDLIEDYKYVDGEHFGERKHWLHDDYVKFIRLAEHLIEKNGEGVLGFITNHGYLDNPTFRGMRWHLLNSFDKIWVLDLHGNAKKKEVTPDGSPDKNVFDIQQGVALIIAMKKRHAKGTKKKLAAVWHGDLWGSRKEKYEALWNDSYTSVSKNLLDLPKPFFHFQSKCLERKSAYQDGFSLADMFGVFGLGFQTSRDDLVVAENKAYLIEKIEAFLSLSGGEGAVRERFFPKHKAGKYKKGDTRQWTLEGARQKLAGDQDWQNDIRPALYRPFDIRQVLYRKDMVDWPRPEVLGHMSHLNLALIANRQTKEEMGAFVACSLTERKIAAVYDASTTFPLYLYPDPNRPNYTEEGHLDETIRVNMDPKILRIIEEAAMGVMPEGDVMPSLDDEGKPDIIPCYGADGRPNEVAIFDYIYGVLHCPNYRETYKEFLKIDFPRIPYPPSPEIFRDVQDKGTQLRRLHLMEPEVIGETPYPFEGEGDGVVGKIDYKEGAVSINDDQYFANVPLIAWEFYIGGYQPAQKWLKDRKGRELSFDDIRHYQRIIKILSETDRIMKTIVMPLGEDA